MFVNTLAEVATYVRTCKAIGVSSSTDASVKMRDAYRALPYVDSKLSGRSSVRDIDTKYLPNADLYYRGHPDVVDIDRSEFTELVEKPSGADKVKAVCYQLYYSSQLLVC